MSALFIGLENHTLVSSFWLNKSWILSALWHILSRRGMSAQAACILIPLVEMWSTAWEWDLICVSSWFGGGVRGGGGGGVFLFVLFEIITWSTELQNQLLLCLYFRSKCLTQQYFKKMQMLLGSVRLTLQRCTKMELSKGKLGDWETSESQSSLWDSDTSRDSNSE